MNRMHLPLFVALSLGTALSALAESRAVRGDRVNVRVEPSREAEVLITLKRGDRVDVRGAESGGWTRIAVPAQVPIWIFGPLVDVPSQKIRAKEANLRSGPGKNYSELGRLHQGDRVTVIRESDGWVQVEPPADISAFISTGLLAGAEDSTVSRKQTEIQKGSGSEPTLDTLDGAEPAPEKPARQLPSKPELSASKALSAPAEVRPVGGTEVVEAPSSNSQSKIRGNSANPVPAPAVPAASPTATPPPAVAMASPPSPVPATPSSYAEGSQVLLRYSETVRSVVRVGRVGLSLEPQSPSYYELASVRRGEGRVGFLVTEDDSIRFGTFRGKVVRVVADEFQTTGSPAKTVLRVKSIVLEPGY